MGPINKRPSVQIDGHDALHRGDEVTFTATITDSNDKLDDLTVQWRVGDTYADARDSESLPCKGKTLCSYTLPAQTKDSLWVVVRVIDSDTATNEASREFSIVNRAPEAVIDLSAPAKSAERYPLLTEFVFSAKNSKDLDLGDQDFLVYKWKVTHHGQEISPAGCEDASKPDVCAFTADDPGDYQVTLTVKDPSQAVSKPMTLDLVVEEDRPPCIRSYSPPVLQNPTLFAIQNNTFAVIMVEDDVSPFPVDQGATSSAKTIGTFKWSTRKGFADDFSRFLHNTNQFAFPQGSVNPGDQVQIRVEYQDGNRSLASCDPNATVCSLNHDDCYQWITWTVTFQ